MLNTCDRVPGKGTGFYYCCSLFSFSFWQRPSKGVEKHCEKGCAFGISSLTEYRKYSNLRAKQVYILPWVSPNGSCNWAVWCLLKGLNLILKLLTHIIFFFGRVGFPTTQDVFVMFQDFRKRASPCILRGYKESLAAKQWTKRKFAKICQDENLLFLAVFIYLSGHQSHYEIYKYYEVSWDSM